MFFLVNKEKTISKHSRQSLKPNQHAKMFKNGNIGIFRSNEVLRWAPSGVQVLYDTLQLTFLDFFGEIIIIIIKIIIK